MHLLGIPVGALVFMYFAVRLIVFCWPFRKPILIVAAGFLAIAVLGLILDKPRPMTRPATSPVAETPTQDYSAIEAQLAAMGYKPRATEPERTPTPAEQALQALAPVALSPLGN